MAAAKPCRILVVDDEHDTAQTFAFLLAGMGHEAAFITDSGQVVDTVNRFKPQIIFLDIGMPGLNGWEVARLIRKQYPPDSPLRLVAITGQSDEKAHIKSRQAGFDAHVKKPAAIDLVEAIIRQLDPRP
jgi:CheY-like chemotaxis protein